MFFLFTMRSRLYSGSQVEYRAKFNIGEPSAPSARKKDHDRLADFSQRSIPHLRSWEPVHRPTSLL